MNSRLFSGNSQPPFQARTRNDDKDSKPIRPLSLAKQRLAIGPDSIHLGHFSNGIRSRTASRSRPSSIPSVRGRGPVLAPRRTPRRDPGPTRHDTSLERRGAIGVDEGIADGRRGDPLPPARHDQHRRPGGNPAAISGPRASPGDTGQQAGLLPGRRASAIPRTPDRLESPLIPADPIRTEPESRG